MKKEKVSKGMKEVFKEWKKAEKKLYRANFQKEISSIISKDIL